MEAQLKASRASETDMKRSLAAAEVAVHDVKREAAAREAGLTAALEASQTDARQLRAALHARTLAQHSAKRSGVPVAPAQGEFVNTNRWDAEGRRARGVEGMLGMGRGRWRVGGVATVGGWQVRVGSFGWHGKGACWLQLRDSGKGLGYGAMEDAMEGWGLLRQPTGRTRAGCMAAELPALGARLTGTCDRPQTSPLNRVYWSAPCNVQVLGAAASDVRLHEGGGGAGGGAGGCWRFPRHGGKEEGSARGPEMMMYDVFDQRDMLKLCLAPPLHYRTLRARPRGSALRAFCSPRPLVAMAVVYKVLGVLRCRCGWRARALCAWPRTGPACRPGRRGRPASRRGGSTCPRACTSSCPRRVRQGPWGRLRVLSMPCTTHQMRHSTKVWQTGSTQHAGVAQRAEREVLWKAGMHRWVSLKSPGRCRCCCSAGEGFPEDFVPFKDLNEPVNAKY